MCVILQNKATEIRGITANNKGKVDGDAIPCRDREVIVVINMYI